MPKITFIDHEGNEQLVEATSGDTLMEAATDNGIEAVEAECGGACSCATCHVYIDEKFAGVTGAAGDMELAMLESAEDVRETSRLSCQITISDDMDNMRVTTPEMQ